ncbi:CoA transferase [Leptolyngbya sp. 15MV]|nr:CoA transferase [Leptolyngbya sp. 15MV]
MGADVIKVEPPGAGDPMRVWGQGEVKVQWEVIARNKRSVTANLRVAGGQDIVRRLAATADVLIENFKPGTLEKWGLGPDELLAANPRLIVARMSGYGQTGPYSDRAGFGGIGEAMGGWRYIVGEPDRPPARMGIPIGDTLCATYGCMGVLAALHSREKTGQGQVIDTALYEAVLQVMEGLVPEYDYNGVIRERSGSILPGIAPSNVYACKDGPFMIGANNDAIFARLAQAMGQPGLATDERYATHLARGAHQAELDALINAWTATLTVAEVDALMIAHSIPAGRVYTAAEMLVDPHYQAREAIVAVDTQQRGRVRMQNAFPKFSRTPSAIRRAAPAVPGQDNAEIYGELLGFDRDRLALLAERGVI